MSLLSGDRVRVGPGTNHDRQGAPLPADRRAGLRPDRPGGPLRRRPQGHATPSCTRSATSPTTCASGWPAIHRPRVAYRDYDAMLADPRVEAVIIAIADQFHVRAALKALEAGKHVLVEKPLGTTVESCRELRDRRGGDRAGGPGRQQPALRPGHRVRPPVHPRGDGPADRAEGLVLRLVVSLHDDRQPPADPGDAARRRCGPEGDPKADRRRYYLLDSRQPPRRHGPAPGRADRRRPRAAARAFRALLLVRLGRLRGRRPSAISTSRSPCAATSRRGSRSSASTAA